MEATDQVPKGKRVWKSLREKDAEIQSLLENDINIDGSKLTLIELLNEYLETLYNRKELRYNTKRSYDRVVKSLEQHKLGHMEIGSVKPVHCEKCLTDMKNLKMNNGKNYHRSCFLICSIQNGKKFMEILMVYLLFREICRWCQNGKTYTIRRKELLLCELIIWIEWIW